MKVEPLYPAPIFLRRRPTVLAEILSERLPANAGEHFCFEVAVGAVEEVDLAVHGIL
jgi:hypothetical protein